MQRWKITTPLELPAADTDLLIMSIFGTFALHAGDEIDLVQQGSLRVIRPKKKPIRLVPNGLTYAIIAQISPG